MSDIEPSTGERQIVAKHQGLRWAACIAAGVMLLTLLPYLYGYSLSDGRPFMWLAYNYDDSCVYLSWMRQAADGSLRSLNLFTTEPQHGMALNPLFLVLGNIARFTHLPLLAIYHASRLIFGFVMLLVIWELIRETVQHRLARQLAFLFVCVSSGLGWLPFWWSANPINTPVDKWQPEAITFLSLYLSPLFCFALAVQAGILLLLFRGERTGRISYALWAGILGLVLALVHTYDVLSLAAVWLLYRICNDIRQIRARQKWSGAPWLQALLAGIIAAPGVVYIAYQLRSEAVFRARANVETLSPMPAYVLLGYGLTFLLALLAVYVLYCARQHKSVTEGEDAQKDSDRWSTSVSAGVFLVTWAIANFAVSYLPGPIKPIQNKPMQGAHFTIFHLAGIIAAWLKPIQRKLLQGEHFPIAILAGIAAAWLLTRPRLRLPARYRLAAGCLLAFILCITNLRFVLRDMQDYEDNIVQTGQQRPFLKSGEMEALRWIDLHVPRSMAVQPLPYVKLFSDASADGSSSGHAKIGATDMSLACLTPGFTGHPVYCGHWGETPDYGAKLMELVHFALPNTTDEQRQALLRKMKVHYLIYSQKDEPNDDADRLAPMFRGLIAVPPYLHLVSSNRDADIYRVDDSVFTDKNAYIETSSH